MDKEKTIVCIKQRILDEHRKHSNLDWAEIAARKIYSSYLNNKNNLTIPDIRNKLTPVVNLLALLQCDEMVDEFIPKEIEQCKKSINYLAQRDVYPL